MAIRLKLNVNIGVMSSIYDEPFTHILLSIATIQILIGVNLIECSIKYKLFSVLLQLN